MSLGLCCILSMWNNASTGQVLRSTCYMSMSYALCWVSTVLSWGAVP